MRMWCFFTRVPPIRAVEPLSPGFGIDFHVFAYGVDTAFSVTVNLELGMALVRSLFLFRFFSSLVALEKFSRLSVLGPSAVGHRNKQIDDYDHAQDDIDGVFAHNVQIGIKLGV